jgi:hypothetical protein
LGVFVDANDRDPGGLKGFESASRGKEFDASLV